MWTATTENDMTAPLLAIDGLVRNWWMMLLRGIAGILFGLIAFFRPGIALGALVLLFGLYAIADGVLAIITAFQRRGGVLGDRWWVLLLEGLVGICAGVITLFYPGITAIVLLYLIAFWALVTGIFELVAAFRLRKVITNEWMLVLGGVVSILFGILLIARPGVGLLTLVFWIGAYALIFGALLIALSLRLRSWGRGRESGASAAMA
jgi:uncharacterized membrane protein HdeD (DUF308 family)